MLTLAKFLIRTMCLGAIALFGAGLLQTAPEASSQLTAARLEFAIRTVAMEFPAQVRSFSIDADNFLTRNATTARFEFESMTDSMSSRLTLNSLLPDGVGNWIQNSAWKASNAMDNEPAAAARKTPVVNRALNSANQHMNAVRHALNGGPAAL